MNWAEAIQMKRLQPHGVSLSLVNHP